MHINHNENIIETHHVSFSYGNEAVLKDISLEVHRGDYIGVIGPNGAGKTTLLKILLGLLTPKTGSVKLFGVDIKEFKEWTKIGYVPQTATHFDPNFPASVFEVVLMGRYAKRGLFKPITEEDRRKAHESLALVGMEDEKNSLIGDLSSGQQQRVFIARALAGEPEVIFLDEPTTGVDQSTREEFYKLLRKLNDEKDLTLVLISHDIDVVEKEVMHVACINHSLTYFGSPEGLEEEMRSRKIFGEDVIIAHHHHS